MDVAVTTQKCAGCLNNCPVARHDREFKDYQFSEQQLTARLNYLAGMNLMRQIEAHYYQFFDIGCKGSFEILF